MVVKAEPGGPADVAGIQPGDVITLAAGATFTGPFTLPDKSGSAWITVRTSAPGGLPPAGTRVPEAATLSAALPGSGERPPQQLGWNPMTELNFGNFNPTLPLERRQLLSDYLLVSVGRSTDGLAALGTRKRLIDLDRRDHHTGLIVLVLVNLGPGHWKLLRQL